MKYKIYDKELNQKGVMPVQLQSTNQFQPMSNPELWNRLDQAKSKQEKLEACYEWISGQGGFGNCPSEQLLKIRRILT